MEYLRTSMLPLCRTLLGLLILKLSHGVSVLELHPPKVVVSYGGSVSVNCSTPSIGHEGMGWEATYGATDLKENCTFDTWAVENLIDWTIVPECYINIGDKQHKKSLLVVLYKTPDSVSISPLNHTGPMVEGTDYQLLCDVQNVAPVHDLTVTWYKGKENVTTVTFDDTKKTPVNVSRLLNITPSRDDNGAQYTCVAELDLGPEGPKPPPIVTSASINITVHYEPLIKDCPSQFADVESSVTLQMVPCRAEGNPHPNATWYREGRQVDASVLLTRRDSGKYVFSVTNDLGSNNSTINITVEYAPEFTCTGRYNCTENTNHKLACTADGNPEPKITWYKDEKEVHFPRRPTREDRGEYIICATNKHGRANHTLHIEIWYGPEFQLGGDTVTVAAGSNVTVNCSADGNPTPEPLWTQNTGEPLTVTTEGRHSTLYITGAATNATYNCTATNRLGTIHKLIMVLVEAPMTSATSMTSTAITTLTTAVAKVSVLELHPPKVVVSYGGSVSVNCSTPSIGHEGMGWEATYGATDLKENCTFDTWAVENLVDWTIVPECYINIGDMQHKKSLLVVLYKTPDSVSISPLNHTGPMVEGTDYQLLCDVQNIAPVHDLTVTWYKGKENVTTVTFDDTKKTPVNVSRLLNITPSRDDNGAQYTCVAELDLGPEGPKPPPIVTSASSNITVHYGPESKLGGDTVTVAAGRNVTLNCSADGNPTPKLVWTYAGTAENVNVTTKGRQSTLRITKATSTNAGNYICIATNKLGMATRSDITVTVTVTDSFIAIILFSVLLLLLFFVLLSLLMSRRKFIGSYEFTPVPTNNIELQ